MCERHWQIPNENDNKRSPGVTATMDQAMQRNADKPAFCSFGKSLGYAQAALRHTA